ncbi:MAG: hypothetical protein ACJAYG_000234 [Oceanicoccus sp.]|jgi:hypothetical protein
MELLEQCRKHAHKYYADLLMAAEKTVADTLFAHSESSNNNQEQRHYFEAMQQLKQQSSAMHDSFRQTLASSFQTFISGQNLQDHSTTPTNSSALSLLQRDELEDELAISVIVSKANSRNTESLWKLNRRLAATRGGNVVSDESNPFAPTLVCNALQAAVNTLGIESKAKILIYKQLGKVFVVSFAKELDALNQLLIDKGILANLRFSISNQSVATSPTSKDSSDTDTESPAPVNVESNARIAHQQELYDSIRALQSALGSRKQTAGGVSFGNLKIDGTGGNDSFAPVDYALALSAIQQSSAFLSAASLNHPMPAATVEAKLIEQLSTQGDPDSRHKMTKQDADTVDLVGMIFRYMLDDPKLHDAVKSLLSHLHTPYLKLALMDKNFLDNFQHPARALLNSMSEIGGKWVQSEEDRTILPKIKSIVETVLTGFVDDPSLFDQLLEDFSRYRESLEKRSRMVEKRNTQSQQGLEKLDLAKQRAADEMLQRLTDANIPANINKLLLKPWSEFLSFNLLRHGDESLTWQSALKVVDGIIWSVRPAAVADNKADFQRHQSDLEKSVSEGLSTIGYDPNASKSLLNALKEAQELAYHNALMNNVQQYQASGHNNGKPITTAKATKPKKANKPKPPKLNAEEQDIVEKLKEIAFGTWFEFDREQAVQLLKLAWFSRVTSHYMFVDHAGIKQMVENQYNLAKGINAGNIRIAEPDKKSFMERALEAVLDKLKLGNG